MKKNVKMLIASAAALAVAGGGYAALVLTGDDNGSSSVADNSLSSDNTSAPTAIFEFEQADIQSVSVKNSSGEFKSVPVPGATFDSEDVSASFTIEGFETLRLDNSLISSLIDSSSALSSDSTAENDPSDLEKYGLGAPQAEVTVKTSNAQKTLLIGNTSPIEGETYCMEKNGDTVYLATTGTLSVFLKDAESFISNVLLEAPADGSTPQLDEIKIERKDIDYDIVLAYDESSEDEDSKSGSLATHYMTKPVFSYLDVEKSQDVINGFYGLTAQYVLAAHPDADTIAASGLDKPFCTVTTKEKDNTYTLKIGDKLSDDSGSYYLVMLSDTLNTSDDVIYAVSSESVCWANVMPGDITSKLIFGTYVWDIAKLDISVNDGETVSFEGSGSSGDDYKVTKNGKECDTERFRSFYTFLLKTSGEDFVIDEEPEGNPIVSISLETQDGSSAQTVKFYKSDGKKALISVNGVPCFKCRMAYVDLLIENLGKFDTGEDFVMNW